jgi:hypothetical protein
MTPETLYFHVAIEGDGVELYSELGLWWGEDEFRRFVKTLLFLRNLAIMA